ncbi:MAG: 50S ribosomal protein L3 [Phycisphaerales bacterium]|jgi:large subunit ribosomal protein L3
MPAAIIGRKLGITRSFTPEGKNIPVTVIEAGPCVVTQVKTTSSDGYAAVQLAYGELAPRRSTRPVIAHDAKAGTAPKRLHREFRCGDDAEAGGFELGQILTVESLEGTKFVDVIGTSKGKGFAGVMKRHNFAGLEASHGVERKHRSAGAIASHGTDRGHGAKIKKGKRMAGQMGNARVTLRSIDVVGIIPDRNLLLLKGPVPGPNGATVFIRAATRLYKRKARIQAGA